ncbi:hypothetical protein EMCG_03099 [[Emmonsia] crescens]|uniref:Uncharacterized protein n=1 Tax=[Emmonsia] crescens TaxID=73230 RepID=A0A0G2J8M4_9EURO|nr:hypothetical protein EMCG_03099 [Emmonsia crescens UAMH 3008]
MESRLVVSESTAVQPFSFSVAIVSQNQSALSLVPLLSVSPSASELRPETRIVCEDKGALPNGNSSSSNSDNTCINTIWLTARLLSSPAFHRTVRQVHKKVQEIRHGKAPEDMGGTNIDRPEGSFKRFIEQFRDELKNQAGKGPPKS